MSREVINATVQKIFFLENVIRSVSVCKLAIVNQVQGIQFNFRGFSLFRQYLRGSGPNVEVTFKHLAELRRSETKLLSIHVDAGFLF
jgi:hypothetical protein